MSERAHLLVLAAVSLAGVLLTIFVPAFPQDLAYHDFADQRRFGGIPNTFDVLSNVPFVLVGLGGLNQLRRGCPAGCLPALLWHYRIFFLGVLLTGFGSAYYHWRPANATLVWDRLPMTIGFMAFFCLLVGEAISLRAGRRLLFPLLLLGVASVLYWHITEQQGRGDLRWYVLVQFLPILLTPYILGCFRSSLSEKFWFWALAGFYLLAKLLELTDSFWFDWTGFVSGHTLKHLLAAAAAAWLLRAVVRAARNGISSGSRR